MKKICCILFVMCYMLYVTCSWAQSVDTSTSTQQGQSLTYAPQSESTAFPSVVPPGLLSPAGGYFLDPRQFTGNIWDPRMFVYSKRTFLRKELIEIAGNEEYILDPNPNNISTDYTASKNITVYVMESMPAPGKYYPLWPTFTGKNHKIAPTPGLLCAMLIASMDKGANVFLVMAYGGDKEFHATSIGASGSGTASWIANSAKEVFNTLAGTLGITGIKSKQPETGWFHGQPFRYSPN